MSKVTDEERFRRAQAHIDEAWSLANRVTSQTPGKERGALIIRVRSQYNHAHSYIGKYLRKKNPPYPQNLSRKAEEMLDHAYAALHHARRFSK